MLFLSIFISGSVSAQLSTQVGIGALYINGDVDPVVDPMNSFHISLNREFDNSYNVELRLGLSKTVGLSGTYMESAQNGGGLVEPAYAHITEEVLYPNYLSTYAYADLGANYILQTGIERFRLIGGLGLGFSISSISVNTLTSENEIYNIKFDNINDIEETKAVINRLYDDTYETKFDEGGFVPHLSMQFGVQFRITRGIYISADVRYHLTNSDYLDSLKYITDTQESGNNDSVSMFTIGIVGYLLSDNSDDRSPLNRGGRLL